MPTKTASGDYVIFTDLPEGNSLNIRATAINFLKQIYEEESQEIIDEYLDKVDLGNYENLKKVTTEFVPILIFGKSSDYSVRAIQGDLFDEQQ